MEAFGGFMMMVSILFFFLAVIWFILPFIILSIKGKVDRSVDQLAEIDRRLAAIEAQLANRPQPQGCAVDVPPAGVDDTKPAAALAPDHPATGH